MKSTSLKKSNYSNKNTNFKPVKKECELVQKENGLTTLIKPVKQLENVNSLAKKISEL